MFIPDSNFVHLGSRIRSKEFKYFSPKKWFLSSRKYAGLFIPDPDPDFYPSRIPNPGVKKSPDAGCRIRISNTAIINMFAVRAGSEG